MSGKRAERAERGIYSASRKTAKETRGLKSALRRSLSCFTLIPGSATRRTLVRLPFKSLFRQAARIENPFGSGVRAQSLSAGNHCGLFVGVRFSQTRNRRVRLDRSRRNSRRDARHVRQAILSTRLRCGPDALSRFAVLAAVHSGARVSNSGLDCAERVSCIVSCDVGLARESRFPEKS